jgi:hypothetical protein
MRVFVRRPPSAARFLTPCPEMVIFGLSCSFQTEAGC